MFRNERLSPNDDAAPHIVVYSSHWFDLKTPHGREMVIRHVLALPEWARFAHANPAVVDGANDPEEEEEGGGAAEGDYWVEAVYREDQQMGGV